VICRGRAAKRQQYDERNKLHDLVHQHLKMNLFSCGGCGFSASKPVTIRRHKRSIHCRGGIVRKQIELIGDDGPPVVSNDDVTQRATFLLSNPGIVQEILDDPGETLCSIFGLYVRKVHGAQAPAHLTSMWLETSKTGKTNRKTVCVVNSTGKRRYALRDVNTLIQRLYDTFLNVVIYKVRDLAHDGIPIPIESKLLCRTIELLDQRESMKLDTKQSIDLTHQWLETRPHESRGFVTLWRCSQCRYVTLDRGNSAIHCTAKGHTAISSREKYREVSVEDHELDNIVPGTRTVCFYSVHDYFHRAVYAVEEGTLNWVVSDVMESFYEYIVRYLSGGDCPERFRAIVCEDRNLYAFDTQWTKYRTMIARDMVKLLNVLYKSFQGFVYALEASCGQIECATTRSEIESLSLEIFDFDFDAKKVHNHDRILRLLMKTS